MSDHHVYKKVEIVGSSKTSIEEAIENALNECGNSVKNMEWFEVTETRGHIVDGKARPFQRKSSPACRKTATSACLNQGRRIDQD